MGQEAVVSDQGNKLRLRSEPNASNNGNIITPSGGLATGDRLLITGGPSDDGSREWWQVQVVSGNNTGLTGWAAFAENGKQYVVPVSNQ